MSEHAWVVERGALRGIRWTGRDFRPTPESWHFNGGYPATLAPIEEEDDMFTDADRALLKNVEGLLAGEGKTSIREEVRAVARQVKDLRADVPRAVWGHLLDGKRGAGDILKQAWTRSGAIATRTADTLAALSDNPRS